MNWPDPDFALQSRLSFGRHGRYAWAIVGAVAIQSVVFLQNWPGTFADGVALLLSILAFPYAAIQLLAQERGGRLELRRLTGKSAGGLSFALVAGASWMPLVAALLAYAVAAFLGVMPPFRAAGAMFMAGAAIAVVLVAAPRSAQLDPWMLVTALFMISGAGVAAVREWPSARVPIIVLAGACVAIALPLARRRVQRPPLLRSVTSTALRPVVRLATTRLPEFSRALLTAGASSGAALFVLILIPALMALAVRLTGPFREPSVVALLYLPVLISAFQCSAATRMDRSTGALDRLRLSGAAGWSVVTQLALGFSVPFLLGWVVAAGYLTVHSPSDARTFLLPWPAFACLCLGAGLAEGLAGRRMGTYLIPALFISLFLAKEQVQGAWWVPALVVWVPMAIAAGRLQRAEGPSLEGGTAAAAFTGLAVMLVLGHIALLFVASAMALGSGFLVPDGRPDRRWRPIVLCAIAAALAAGVAEYYFIHWWIGVRFEMRTAPSGLRYLIPTARSHALYAVLTGAYTGGGLLLGWLLHNRFGATTIRSLTARASVGVMAWLTLWALDVRWWDWADALEVGLLGLLIVAIIVLLFSGTPTRHARHRS